MLERFVHDEPVVRELRACMAKSTADHSFAPDTIVLRARYGETGIESLSIAGLVLTACTLSRHQHDIRQHP